MENFYVQYLLKILISSAIFYLAYGVLLRKDTCFALKRIYLILAIIIPILYPFVTFSMSTQSLDNSITLQTIVVSNQNLQSYLTENVEMLRQYHLQDFILGIWIVGILISLFLFGVKLYGISQLYKSTNIVNQYRIGKCKVYETMGTDSFSFFNTIFISNDVDTNKNEILQHELLHVKYAHSLELICLELISILFWWNPIFHLLKQEVSTNHEYMVDQKMIRAGVNKKGYQYMLLRATMQNSSMPMVNYFNVSQLKKRISMMNKRRTTSIGYVKYLMILLLPMLFLVANSKPLYATEMLVVENSSTTVKPYDFVEVMPKFPGGPSAMMNFIKDNLVYPVEAQEEGKQGRVTVKFVVAETGDIEDVTVVRGINPAIDQAAIEIIKKMPKWTPGQQGGKNVAVNFNIPIVFKLKD